MLTSWFEWLRASRRRWIILTIAALAVVAGALAILAVRVPFTSEILRSRVIAALRDRLNADVELGALTLRVFPRFEARGEQLIIRHKGRRDVPPLFSIDVFQVNASVLGLWRRHVSYVKLEGLTIQIPPGDDEQDDKEEGPDPKRGGPHLAQGKQVVVDLLEAPGAKLVIVPKDKDKPPKTWELHELRVESVSAVTAMPFKALLTNAVPPGRIATEGTFGPWHRDDPGHSPVEGEFTFENADLGVFKGIDGTLSASGRYGGSLERIEAKGRTDVPDFMLEIARHEVPLKTTFHAIVDGTNGNTLLEQVDASFLHTSLTARGGVIDVERVKGRRVTLDVSIERGRLEDILRLAVKTPQPPMSGALRLVTKFDLPPGARDVVERLRLNGRFTIERGRFADPTVQQKIAALSRRARGKPAAASEPNVESTFAGRFVLSDGILTVPDVTFDVPGAVVYLKGRYGLEDETIDFSGELVMDAKLSQTTTGFKAFLLKAVDPLFRREGRTVIPIKISGTRSSPSFGLDVKRVVGRK